MKQTQDKQYYIYSMSAVKSNLGKDYIGCTSDLKRRALQHRYKLELFETPELIVLYGPFSDKKLARAIENDLREANGFHREGVPQGRLGGLKAAITNVASGQLDAIRTKEVCAKGGAATKGYKHVYKGDHRTSVPQSKVREYLDNGYILGYKKIN
jgi:predicted GIY-YIG superfamily endonuclease